MPQCFFFSFGSTKPEKTQQNKYLILSFVTCDHLLYIDRVPYFSYHIIFGDQPKFFITLQNLRIESKKK